MFILDREFAIERPDQYYRKLGPLQQVGGSDSSDSDSDEENPAHQMTIRPIFRARLSKKLYLSKHSTTADVRAISRRPREARSLPSKPSTLDHRADKAIEHSHNAKSLGADRRQLVYVSQRRLKLVAQYEVHRILL